MIEITVCVGGSCHLKGAYGVVEQLEQLVLKHQLTSLVRICARSCMDQCRSGVCVHIDGEYCPNVSPRNIGTLFEDKVLPITRKNGDG